MNPSSALVVFSHPNHEIAIYGLLQRWKPALLYLTDGGGPDRVSQTREGLRRIGLAERAAFLDRSEQAFYSALLDVDTAFFDQVAREIAQAIDACAPDRILCDAVEYYNPVHDLSLPLVFRALSVAAPDPPPAVFEIPLIRQASTAPSEAYIVQRPVPSRAASQVAYALTPAETAAKRQARDETYTILAAQLGPVLCTIPDQELATEVVVPAVLSPGIAPDCILRYEWRAQRLREQGAIEHPITFADHFLPLARALAGDRLQPLA